MVSRNLEWFLSRFRSGEPFTFSRWGDGEWRAVCGTVHGVNCDGHPFHRDLQRELGTVLRSKPTYPLGMQPMSVRIYGDIILQFLNGNKIKGLEWSDGDIFHKAAIAGKLGEITESLKDRKLLIVGAKHLAKLTQPGVLDPKPKKVVHIDVHGDQAFTHRKRTIANIKRHLLGPGKSESWIVFVCMGMTAEIVIHELNKDFGDAHTIVDFGSVFDPLAGVFSRKYMKVKP